MSTQDIASGRRIVVGVDGSDHSQGALKWGASYAAAIGASLDVVTVLPTPTSYDWSIATDDSNPAQDSGIWLAEFVEDVLGSRPPRGLRLSVRQGSAVQVLLSMSEGATMLVVGRRGRGGFGGLHLGSVSAHCVEQSRCPVLVVSG